MTDTRNKLSKIPRAGQTGSHAVARVLIVDDSPETRFIYCRHLRRSGRQYEIVEAQTVAEGMAVLDQGRVDCVLLDYCLPDETGLDLLNELAGTRNSLVPVVMITGQGDEAVAVEAMKLGANDYLIKNQITADSLVAAIEVAIKQASSERELSRYTRELEQQAITDPLTGLHNRRHLFERLNCELERARRYETPLCLLLIDLDHFKQINDSYGHVVGDAVLTRFADMLSHMARSSDLVARYGGEEFCVALTQTDLDGAVQFAERICAASRNLRHDNGCGDVLHVSCSVGVTAMTGEEPDIKSLISNSDQALYSAKRQGRDRVCTHVVCDAATA